MTRSFKFGDRVEMVAASASNPLKYGIFVKQGFNTSFVNHGAYFEITDGKGKFWRTDPENVIDDSR